ncbi:MULTISPECIES: signal peptidase I [Heyndrickxia]|uniref:Signal peptidase I n=1 Tax=Heyndrickxia oleronia TaxID=38875 RepID=A0A8E2I7G8_9BACI|nr:signal peptidase I [Heyndrickxia oleronia]NYV64294.1 signal peptidase I [Bacillus sp. Gen3]OJH17371.1 signal peptidase I [Bacillus obstructivus]MBU5212600.1 signal peptidase I [Heyndrickxia oleronia]MCI1591930.1 signal peptidase I [Heyndrickxia oleronia]MCI1612766.1 signal peptidase I [Heyndrickxia oleronia]
MKEKKKSELFSWIKSILLAVVIVLVCRYFVFTPSVVVGESMMPNLQDGNRIIVSKLSDIKRFDEIVFHAPDADEHYVKRVIGLPGDSIEMKDDVLYINGKAYKEPYLKENRKDLLPMQQLTEDFTLKEKTGKSKVPKGYLFVLGDNRLVSKDSRYFGVIPMDSVIGKVKIRFWPLNEFDYFK